jgi:hypothetical protein
MPAPTPQFLPSAFAIDAADPTFRNTIPDTTATPGRASFELGFPPLTMTPVIAGGVPPFGQDVNGILYMLSTHAYAAQAGQPPLWSSAVRDAIAGYALGTVLGSTDGSTLWFNVVADNMTDPDSGASAGWVPVTSYGITTVAGVTGGTATLTPAQARKSVLRITGALVANAAIVVPNWVAQRWLIANATTGAFTLTVRTAAGTGVVVPQGDFAQPVGVYGDGVNIYPVITPLSIPTSVAAAPDTYVLRDNTGLGSGATAAPGTKNPTLASTAFVRAAAVAGRGGIVASNGAPVALPAGFGSSRTSLGHYTVTHPAGFPNYAVTIIMYNNANPPRAQWSATPAPGLNQFTVVCFNQTDGVFQDLAFQFTVAPIV